MGLCFHDRRQSKQVPKIGCQVKPWFVQLENTSSNVVPITGQSDNVSVLDNHENLQYFKKASS